MATVSVDDPTQTDLTIRSAWLTAGALVVAFLIGWGILRSLPETPRQGRLAVGALSERTQVILLGSSHVYTDVDPARVGRPWMNLAGGMLNYELAESVLAAHAARLPQLQAVLLEADPVLSTVDSLTTYHGDNRPILDLEPDLQALPIHWTQRLGLARDRLLTYQLPVHRVFAREKLDLDSLREALFEPKVTPVAAGYEPHAGTAPEGLVGAERVRMHQRASPDAEASSARNLAALARIVRRVQTLGVPLILVRFPHHLSYVESRPPELAAAFGAIVHTVQRAAAPVAVPLLDYEQLADLSDRDFYDADHLNVEGSERFSSRLGSAIASLLGKRGLAHTLVP